MVISTLRWKRAAQRYVASKLPGFEPRPKHMVRQENARDIEEFMNSSEGSAALELLKAYGGRIFLGETKPCMHRNATLFLDCDGFALSYQEFGTSSLYSKNERREERLAPEELTNGEVHNDELFRNVRVDLVTWLCKELDLIATQAP